MSSAWLVLFQQPTSDCCMVDTQYTFLKNEISLMQLGIQTLNQQQKLSKKHILHNNHKRFKFT